LEYTFIIVEVVIEDSAAEEQPKSNSWLLSFGDRDVKKFLDNGILVLHELPSV
jgi:hypothetical protein